MFTTFRGTFMSQQFGGDWTILKLECLRKYLGAYVNVMKNQKQFTKWYIDAFAGTGYVELGNSVRDEPELLFDCQETAETAKCILAGSAEQSLCISPSFDRYIFIEQDRGRAEELKRLQVNHLDQWSNVDIRNDDANNSLRSICKAWRHGYDRGVVFLDPFGMSVDWATLEAISATKSLDLWYLFPISAVNRLLVRDGEIPLAWKCRLTKVLGSDRWEEAFFTRRRSTNLFEDIVEDVTKRSLFQVADFVISQLKTIFPLVADPLWLKNSRGSPLFLFCFAVSNPSKKAREIAKRISDHILRSA